MKRSTLTDFTIEATDIFKLSLKRFKLFLTRQHGVEYTQAFIEELQKQIDYQLSAHPYSASISERMFSIGVTNYRQLTVSKYCLVLFKINENERVVRLDLVMDSRQSIRKLLEEVNLLF